LLDLVGFQLLDLVGFAVGHAVQSDLVEGEANALNVWHRFNEWQAVLVSKTLIR